MNEKTSASAGDVVQKLERMVELVSDPQGGMDANAQAEFALLYGELEDVITGFVGTGRVEVPGHYGNLKNIFPNFIAAGFLSGRNFQRHEGRMQLLQVIGKAKSRIRAPLTAEASISALVRSLGRFRECCQYISEPPKNERDVQEILWIMMRAQFDRLDREDVCHGSASVTTNQISASQIWVCSSRQSSSVKKHRPVTFRRSC
jgi:hypothetical protein